MTKPPWYGGNKIPQSYLAKFLPPKPVEEQDMPHDLRVFLNGLGNQKAS